jgi:hypothetical protein
MLRPALHLFAWVAAFGCLAAIADAWEVDTDTAVFAVVTQRGGIAARLAHDHLITASEYTASVTGDDGTISAFTFECAAADLAVDDPEKRQATEDRLIELGLLASEFKGISADNRATVRDHMLADDQLDADQFPAIRAVLTSVSERQHRFRDEEFTHTATIELTLHGVTVTREVSAHVTTSAGTIEVEAAGSFTFSEFDIEPYSGMLGAVRNKDEFFLYCRFQARPVQ